MKKALFTLVCLLAAALPSARAGAKVTTVDFLAPRKLRVNGAGPVLVKADPARHRIVLANTYTSSVSVIAGPDHQVSNIPLAGRIPQYLKAEIMALDGRTGNIYLIGRNALHVIDPEAGKARFLPTPWQFEMLAVDEATGDAFLVGRETRHLGIYRAKSGALTFHPWAEKEEKLVNLNMTPPPPIRKVVYDPGLGRVLALDGYTPALFTIDPVEGKVLSSRKLALVPGARWHHGGYNQHTHRWYLVVETAERKVVQAASLDAQADQDILVDLPQLTEGVGILYNRAREEIYIPYDNHPTVHAVSFREGKGEVAEIKVPAYGNDGSALDEAGDVLYIASWAWGEVVKIDLKSRKLVRRYLDLGILPHQFAMAFQPASGKVYLPLGATAVNGVYGAALTALDPANGKVEKIPVGWAPVDLIQRPGHASFLVFNSEDEMAEVQPDGSFVTRKLPLRYPHRAVPSPEGNVYLAYGPHQSYWPVVYIWGAKNGILTIDARTLEVNDRRIPELSQAMVTDGSGALWALQNNWGEQKQYLITLPDEVRAPNLGDMRVELDDTVIRETTQRILKFDAAANQLYIGRLGEKDEDPGVLQLFDLASRKVVRRLSTGLTPVDLVFDAASIWVANFDSNTVTRFAKAGEGREEIPAGRGPLKLAALGDKVFVLNHLDNTLQEVRPGAAPVAIPFPGLPDNLIADSGRLLIASHSSGEVAVLAFDPETRVFLELLRAAYPFGETRFDTANTAFYQRGQFGDARFEITGLRTDSAGRLWVADYLAGKVFIVQPK